MKLMEWSDFGKWTGDDHRSLISALGEQNALAVKSGQLVLRVTKPATDTEPGEFVLEQPVRPLFDHTSRVIPPQGLKAKVVDANRSFHLIQPKIDYTERLARLETAFQRRMGITATEFEGRIADLMWPLSMDPLTANLVVGGVCLPIVVPQTETSKTRDYGTVSEQIYIAAVKRAHQEQFLNRTFKNWRVGELAGQVKVVEKRHEHLLDAIYRGPAVGLIFPNPLQGFSIPADREVMNHLPENFLPTGVFDTATALAGYPDVLARDFNTPGLDCAAVLWQSSECSLDFNVVDVVRLNFAYRDLGAYGSYSAGLLVLG